MRCTRGLLALSVSVWVVGSAHAFLPQDRFAWWDAIPPPSGEFREDDSLGEYFNEPIVQVVDFARAGGWPPEAIVSVRRGDGNAARLAVREVIENGSRQQRLVLEAESGLSDPEGGPASDPPGNRPTLLEFSTPQRAVAIEFGFICISEAGCQTSSGRRGAEAGAFELRAFDQHRRLIVSASLPGSYRDELSENRVDYVIGLRDQDASIHRVELSLGRDNPAGSPLEATILIRRIHHEAFPHAAVLQLEVPVGAPVVEALPFHFDNATAIVRGFDLSEPSIFALTGYSYRVDAVVAGGAVTLTASGTSKTEVDKNSAPIDRVFVSLLGWDSSQVELYVQDNTLTGRGEQVVGRDRFVADPCGNNACGPASGPGGWPSVVMTAGLDFDQVDPKGNNRWNLVTLNHDPTFNRDLSRGLMQIFFGAAVLRDGDDPTYEVDMLRRIFAGRSVVESTNAAPSSDTSFPVPGHITQTNVSSRIMQYGAGTLEALGHFCDVDAPVVAVGGRVFWLNADGAGNPYVESRGQIPESIDMEVRGMFTGGRVRAKVFGRLRNVPVGLGQVRPQGQVFVTPVCAGIKRVRRDAVPIVSGARFVGLLNRSSPAREKGRVHNRGPGSFTIRSLRLAGPDASAFDLNVLINGQYYGAVASLSGTPSILLRPGDALEIDGSFLPQQNQQHRAELRLETDLPGQQTLILPVAGRIPSTAEWFPGHVNFGMQELNLSAARNALVLVQDIIPVQIDCFEVAGDPERNFTAIPDPAFQGPCDGIGSTLNSGESMMVQIAFNPTVLPRGANVDDKSAELVAHTDYGSIALPLFGTATAPPDPIPELLPSAITFGLVADGEVEEETLTLYNHGLGALALSTPIPYGDSSFDIDPAPGDWPSVVAPNSAWTFSVRFVVSAPSGVRNGSLDIPSNAGTLTVTYSGYPVE